MLHQINVYIKELVVREKLPKYFSQTMPDNVQELAAAIFEDLENSPLYPEV